VRIHALDIGGSAYVYKQKAFCAVRRNGKEGDLFVPFDRHLGKIRKWEEVIKGGHNGIVVNPMVKSIHGQIFDWMESRFISSHDTLIVYSDFIESPFMPKEDTFYRTEFVTYGIWPGQKFFNSNVYRVGDSDEGYNVLPWPDHPALVSA
jgi:hypothetical protein